MKGLCVMKPLVTWLTLLPLTSSITRTDKFQDKKFVESVLDKIKPDNLRSFLKTLTKEPHLAASDRDKWLVTWMRMKWEEFGLDSVRLSSYNFLISNPDEEQPNKIFLYDNNDRQVWASRHREEGANQPDQAQLTAQAFNAYAPSGDVTGELVYVNYGRVEDMLELEQLGVNLTGRIAIARYGKIFRGSKLINCQRAGAIGLILYSDPDEVAREGLEPEKVYPNTFFLPDSGIQKGSVCEGDGDPLSPEWPSIKGAYRPTVNMTETVNRFCFQGLSGIPSQPIGYGDAEVLLKVMGGQEVPAGWKGGLPGITYRLGPGFDSEHRGWKVRLVVNNNLKDIESSNLIGIITGELEPDRYIIIGNHRDSWGYGAADPSSGTCALMEIARVMGSMVKSGWRPRRTIVFASWAVEEYGSEGSHEYVFENIHKLMDRAVANINMDTCVAGPILVPKASPVLKDVVLAALKAVRSPESNRTRSLYDFFLEYNRREDPPLRKVEERIQILGAGSDHSAFAFYAGVPAVYLRFEPDKQIYKGLSGYPVYHTGFDNFYLMDTILDPGFKIIRSCAQLTTHMALNFADSSLLPLSPKHIITELRRGIREMEERNITKLLVNNGAGPAYQLMVDQLDRFQQAVSRWSSARYRLARLGDLSQLEQRALNDQLMLLERVFLLPKGLPGRPEVRHALFSPAKFDAYGGASFSGITDQLFGVEKLSLSRRQQVFESVKRHLSDLMIIFRQAEQWLGPLSSL